MSKPTDISSLSLGARVQETLLVLDVDRRSSNDGSPFTVITLGHSSGVIDTAPVWLDQEPLIAGVHRGHVAVVIGRVETWRGRLQLRVSSFRVLPAGTVEPQTLLPSAGEAGRYWRRVMAPEGGEGSEPA